MASSAPTRGWAVWGRPLLLLAALLLGPLLLVRTPLAPVAVTWGSLLLLALWAFVMAAVVGGLAGAPQSALTWLEGHLRRWVAWFAPDPEALWLAWARAAHRPASAHRCLDAAVRLGGAEALFQEGLVFLEGGYGPGGQAAAVARFRKAAALGHAEAAFRLAEALRTGLGSPTAEPAEALVWCQRSAGKGLGPAAAWLAQAHATGDGVPVDEALAKHWTQVAAALHPHPPLSRNLLRHDAAPPDPLVRLGQQAGRGLEQGMDRVVAHRPGRWLVLGLLALLAGGAFLFMGTLFWSASTKLYHLPLIVLGVPMVMLGWQAFQLWRERPSTRRDRLREAAERGDPEACYRIGLQHQRGSHHLPKDGLEAVRWFRRAADAGHPAAMAAMAEAYLAGHGVLRDPREAARWAEAARRGSTS